jgi:MerR family mercuric resistance operon transcriptional regulator
MKNKYTIGALAKDAGISVETIRFYEKKGLLQQPSSKNGYRQYKREDVQKIHFIKQIQSLGFTLNEAKEFLDLRIKSNAKCLHIRQKTELKKKEIDKKLRVLKDIKRSLNKLIASCDDGELSASECPILEYLNKGGM